MRVELEVAVAEPEAGSSSALTDSRAQNAGADVDLAHVQHTYSDGGYYEGQWLDGKRHGQGKMHWPSGDCYEGQWLDDKKHGQGKYNYSRGGY